MATVNDTLLQIRDILVGLRDDSNVKLDAINFTLGGIQNDLNAQAVNILAALEQIRLNANQTVAAISAGNILLELINNNASGNNQSLLSVLVGSACCDPPVPIGTVAVAGKCGKAQNLYDYVTKWLCYLAPFGSAGIIPPADEIRNAYTDPLLDPLANSYITASEILFLQGAVVSQGYATLASMCDLTTNTALREKVAKALNDGSTSAEGRANVRAVDLTGTGVSDAQYNMFLAGFTARAYDELYNSETLLTGGGYAYDCGAVVEPPPDYRLEFLSPIVDDIGTDIQDVSLTFGGTVYEAVPGDRFRIKLISVESGTFTGADLTILPGAVPFGSLTNVGDEADFIVSSGQNGVRITYAPPIEGGSYQATIEKAVFIA